MLLGGGDCLHETAGQWLCKPDMGRCFPVPRDNNVPVAILCNHLVNVATRNFRVVRLKNPKVLYLWLAGAGRMMRFREAFVKFFVVFFLRHYKKYCRRCLFIHPVIVL